MEDTDLLDTQVFLGADGAQHGRAHRQMPHSQAGSPTPTEPTLGSGDTQMGLHQDSGREPKPSRDHHQDPGMQT